MKDCAGKQGLDYKYAEQEDPVDTLVQAGEVFGYNFEHLEGQDCNFVVVLGRSCIADFGEAPVGHFGTGETPGCNFECQRPLDMIRSWQGRPHLGKKKERNSKRVVTVVVNACES